MLFRKEAANLHAKNLGQKHNPFVGCRGATSFNVGNDLASHVTPKQLHFGGEHFLCPTCLMPKLDHVLSNDVCIFEHTFQRWRNQTLGYFHESQKTKIVSFAIFASENRDDALLRKERSKYAYKRYERAACLAIAV